MEWAGFIDCWCPKLELGNERNGGKAGRRNKVCTAVINRCQMMKVERGGLLINLEKKP
jgi:hypothetical protein